MQPTDIPTTPPTRSQPTWQVAGICLFLTLAVWGVFGQTARFGFINYDDDKYVYDNPMVRKGLTWPGVLWASTYSGIGHWHPLTWLTHMADCQLFGLHAGGHHLTNLALHAITAMLLFLVWRAMTGALWRSAFVAAIFALHPLRAESVAWIAERKDVLSGLFFMLTLWAYERYVRQPSRGRYAAVALLFGLGLLSKNMLVTLPFVLLVLDWWPLGRMKFVETENGKSAPDGRVPFWGLLKEKIPLFLLSAGSCVATALVSEKLGDLDRLPLWERLGNAVVCYVIYLWQTIFPANLANLYPFPQHGRPIWQVGLALVLLAGITAGTVASRKRSPFLLAGWLWYLGMLVPAIGIVQISYYSHADRYTYLPGIGLIVAGTWAMADWSAGWKYRRILLGGLTTAALGALMICAHIQTSYWKDSGTLWRHTLACTSDNYVAHLNLGNYLFAQGQVDEAITQYGQALAIVPDNVGMINDLGNALARKGADAEAMAQFQKALKLQPADATTHVNLGNFFQARGKLEEALAQYRQAAALAPADVGILNNLGNVLARTGADAEATAQYQKALNLDPDCAATYANLGNDLRAHGKLEEAVARYRQALAIAPDDVEILNNLGKTLAMKGDDDGAIAEYKKALAIQPGFADVHFNLGNRLLSQGKWDEAIAHYRAAVEINPNDAAAKQNMAKAIHFKMLYETNRLR